MHGIKQKHCLRWLIEIFFGIDHMFLSTVFQKILPMKCSIYTL